MSGKTCLPIPSLGLLDVVFHTTHEKDVLLVVVEGVGGSWIAVPRLAHRADIDGVALGGIESDGFIGVPQAADTEGLRILLPDPRDMGVSVEADEGGLGSKVASASVVS